MTRGSLVSIYLPSLAGGGAERAMLNLARGLTDQGVRTHLVLASASGPYLSRVSTEVKIVDLRAGGVLRSLPGLVRYMREHRPRAMVSALNHANIIAIWARRFVRPSPRLLVSVQNNLSRHATHRTQLADFFVPHLARMFFSQADAVVAVSEGVADDLVGSLRVPEDRVHVIFNPIVTPEIGQGAQKPLAHDWFLEGQPPVVVGVGSLTPQKDFPTLIRAFSIARQVRPLRLIILGEGNDRASLAKLIEDLGLEEDVQLPGFVENPFAYMARASVFVLSSVYEGLPSVLIEAMSLGTPVVSTRCRSGPEEILDGGKYGTLVSEGNPDELAGAILRALAEPPDAAAQRARAELYKVESVTREFLKLMRIDAPERL